MNFNTGSTEITIISIFADFFWSLIYLHHIWNKIKCLVEILGKTSFFYQKITKMDFFINPLRFRGTPI